MKKQDADDAVRKVIKRWGAKGKMDPNGVVVFTLGDLHGLAYATGPGNKDLRATFWIDDPVNQDEAEAWVDANDTTPFGGPNVFRAVDLQEGYWAEPDEFALRFSFTEPFTRMDRIEMAPSIARDLRERWLRRHR